MGEDYERKMAVVAVLKQYAEDRDVDILCRSLDAILNTPLSRSILRHIRLAELKAAVGVVGDVVVFVVVVVVVSILSSL